MHVATYWLMEDPGLCEALVLVPLFAFVHLTLEAPQQVAPQAQAAAWAA